MNFSSLSYKEKTCELQLKFLCKFSVEKITVPSLGKKELICKLKASSPREHTGMAVSARNRRPQEGEGSCRLWQMGIRFPLFGSVGLKHKNMMM